MSVKKVIVNNMSFPSTGYMNKKKNIYLQMLRGAAITAVVFIHTMPASTLTIAVRPFLNWAVALFIFLSGFLTPKSKIKKISEFYGRRIYKILIPYLVWTIIYIGFTIDRLMQWDIAHIIKQIAKDVLLGQASLQLYYCIVYLCLVLLTPLIYKLLDSSCWWVVYAITPATLLLKYISTPFDFPSIWGPFFGTWIIFYVIGLEWNKRFMPIVHRHSMFFWSILAISLTALQMVEGFFWQYTIGKYDVATSQLKISSMLSSVAVIAFLMCLKQKVELKVTKRNVFAWLGDLSFGIYLSHMIIQRVILHILPDQNIFMGFVCGLITLILTALCDATISHVFPKRIREWIGFI